MNARRLSGRQVLFVALAFFSLVIGVNAILVTLALRTFSGADEDNAYKSGLDFNATLARRAAETESGIAMAVDAARDEGGEVRISARMTRGTAPAPGLVLTGVLRHPANRALDREIVFAGKGEGLHEAKIADLPSGQWDLVVWGKSDGAEIIEARKRLWLP